MPVPTTRLEESVDTDPEVVYVYAYSNTNARLVSYIDIVNDFSVKNCTITWRRSIQQAPEGMSYLGSFTVKDAQDRNVNDLAEILLNDLSVEFVQTSDAVRAVEKIQAGVRRAIPTGVGWGYVHSKQYEQLVIANEAREQKTQESIEPMQPWELELLYGTSSELESN